jgi:hypothetical protein
MIPNFQRIASVCAASALAVALLACNESSTPTAPNLRIVEPSRYAGTVQILGVEGASTDAGLSCAIGRLRSLVGMQTDFELSLGDLPLLLPPGGRWSSSLFGVASLGCRMSYVESAGGIEMTDLYVSCTNGRDTSILDEQAAPCGDEDSGPWIDATTISTPPLSAAGAAIQGTGRIPASVLRGTNNGFSSVEVDIVLLVSFDLRR